MSSPPKQLKTVYKVLAAIVIIFGLATIKEGGSVLFGIGSARQEAGHYVQFVLLFNFIAGFFYVGTGALILLKKNLATYTAVGIFLGSLLVFAAFGIHIWRGGLFETRTVAAMTLRTGLWFGIVVALHQSEIFACRIHRRRTL